MFKNYFTIALRSIWKNKVFAAINIFGLAIGISASLVIYLLVNYDFSFDKFEKDNSRIYRITSLFNFSGEAYHNSGVPSPMGNAVQQQVTGLDVVAFFRTHEDNAKVAIPIANSNPIIFKNQEKIVYVDENYFKLIEYKWLAGSAKTSLLQPYQIVLTEDNAKLYFPKFTTAEIIGKEIIINDTVHTTVTGIVKNIEQNTDFNFKTFISKTTIETTSLKPGDWEQWGNTNGASQLFIKLSVGKSASQIQTQIENLYKKNNKRDPDDHTITTHILQPLSDLHFNADYGNFDQRTAHKPTLYGLLAVAAFLLLLGCINFINLTTAQASQRAKEIGIRKTMGSSRPQLIFQFLSETLFLTFTATILSILITPLLLKVFADFIPEGLHFNILAQPSIMLFLLVLMVVVSLLSGIYPALILSSYKPVLVLKNQVYSTTGNSRNAWLRKTLTISQFVIAQVFIIATILVSKQISYTLNADLGFKKDAIVYFETNYYDTVSGHIPLLQQKLKAIPEIAMVSLSNYPPTAGGSWSSTFKYKDGKKEVESDVQIKIGDSNFIKLYQMKLLAGKNLSQSDTITQFIINETYSKILGFKNPQQAIGKYVEWDSKQMPIAGVVADFHQESLHDVIRPLVIGSWSSQERTFNIALQPQIAGNDTWKTGIVKIEKAWKEVYPDQDFDYNFLDESIAKFYEAEQNISRLLMWATGLAIFISCLGLLGLVMYVTNQRTKEIGVRKIVGASVTQIVSLISKEFLKLVFIAFIIAVPLAWWGANKWLQNFAYRTEISWWVFALAGMAAMLIAMITVGFRAMKAAVQNPVKSLRTE